MLSLLETRNNRYNTTNPSHCHCPGLVVAESNGFKPPPPLTETKRFKIGKLFLPAKLGNLRHLPNRWRL